MATFELSDDSVVVIVGSGAGGGTLGNELAQKGIKVVMLEAGKHESIDTFQNDEWGSFLQISWLDKRTTSGNWRVARDFAGLPAWICKTVGGTTTHWAGASLRIQEHEFKARTTYGDIPGANLLDWPVTLAELEPYYAKAEDKMGVTRTNGIPGLPGNNNFKVFYTGAKRLGLQGGQHRPHGDQQPAARRPAVLPADRLLLPGLQVLGQVVDALHRDPGGARDRQSRAAARNARRCRSSTTTPARSPACSTPTRTASSRCRRRASSASPATRSRARACCSTRPRPSSRTASPTPRARSAGTTCGT